MQGSDARRNGTGTGVVLPWQWSLSMRLREKRFWRPMPRRICWGRFIVEAKSKDCLGFRSGVSSPSVPPWKKSGLAFIKPRNRAHVQKVVPLV